MDNEQKTPSAETLRQMPYTELKRLARQRGIKANLKAEKLIAALTSIDSDDTDSFSTPAAKMLNSSQKQKIEKFDEDSMTPLVTPRRGTYSIGSPIALKKKNESPPLVANESSALDVFHVTDKRRSERKLHNRQQNEASVSPVPNDLSILDMSNVTVGRGSERKLRDHKNSISPSSVINESSVLDMSNVTVGRGSERKLRNRKVSFLSPVMTPRTPKNSNLKMRPKTPIGSRTPLAATISTPPMKEFTINLGERVNVSLHATPLPEKTSDESSIKLGSSFINKSESKKKRLATPNFKKIHEKAFEKMESIDDYQKRVMNSAKKLGGHNFKANKVTKAKSKIPDFGGIPFIPSKSVTTKWNASTLNKSKQVEEKRQLNKRESKNVNRRTKTKFDLKASLSKKLGYKPYSGPLKPLTPSNLNTSSVCDHKSRATPAKEPVNKVVTSNRMQSRSILKGVRTNKRFELQMKNRLLQ